MPLRDVLRWVIEIGNRKGENTAEGRDTMLLSMVRDSGHQLPSALANDTDLIHYAHLRLQGRVVSLPGEEWPRQVQMLRTTSCALVYFYPNDGPLIVAFDERDKYLDVWNVKAESKLYTISFTTSPGTFPHFYFPDHTEKNPRILVVSDTGQAKVYEVSSGRELCTLQDWVYPMMSPVPGSAFSDEDFMVLFSGSTLRTFYRSRSIGGWDANTGTCLYRTNELEKLLLAPSDRIISLPSLPPDGEPILTIRHNSSPDYHDTLSLEKINSEPIIFQRDLVPLGRLPHPHFIWCGFSPDKKRVVATDTQRIVDVWDAGTAQQLCSLDHDPHIAPGYLGPTVAQFSSDSTLLVTADSFQIKVWDTKTWKCLHATAGVIDGPWFLHRGVSNLGISFSPDGEQIMVVSGLDMKRLQWISPQRFTAATIEDERVSPKKFDLLPSRAKQRIYANFAPKVTPEEAVRLFNTPPPWYLLPFWEKLKVDAVNCYVSQLPCRDTLDKPLETQSARTPSNMQRLLRTIYRCFCSAVAWFIDMLASLLPGQWIEKPRWV